MKKILLILGNITFNNFSNEELDNYFGGKDQDDKNKCLIHEVQGVLFCDTIEQAEQLGELLCNEFVAYVIPSVFVGKISFEPNAKKDIYNFAF